MILPKKCLITEEKEVAADGSLFKYKPVIKGLKMQGHYELILSKLLFDRNNEFCALSFTQRNLAVFISV